MDSNIVAKKEPFSFYFSENLPDLLYKLQCSLLISTYQAGKLISLFSTGTNKIYQLPRSYKKPMGIAIKGDKLALGTLDEVVVHKNAPRLAKKYPDAPQLYDALFMPRATYYTGQVDMHDMHYDDSGNLWGVNTLFSCLVKIDDDQSFTPQWKPPFISELVPEDRCHLNSIAMLNGRPKYVSALGKSNTKKGWRENISSDGVIVDVENDKILLDKLPMPHSARIYNNKLYALLSATGNLMVYNLQSGDSKIIDLPGFPRGMDEYNNYLFIGLSKIRESSSSFEKLPVRDKAKYAGIVVIYIPTLSIVGEFVYENSVEEIYDVKVLGNIRRPGIVSPKKEVHKKAIAAPDLYFWKKANNLNKHKN